MNYTNTTTQISDTLPKVYTNNSITPKNNQEIFSQYQRYLQKVIKDYTPNQKELYDEIKDLPNFKRFYSIVTKWVYCEFNSRFYHIDDKQLKCKDTFITAISSDFDYFIDQVPENIKKQYKKYLHIESFLRFFKIIPSIDGFFFDAPSKSPVVYHNKQALLNTYDHDLLTKTKPIKAFTAEDKEAIRRVEYHLKELVGYDKILDDKNQPTDTLNSDFFLDWIAHQVQHPSQLLRYAPIIQGTQGCGKSWLLDFLKAIVCDKYVEAVSNTELKNSFNPYATERLINVVEELHIKGKEDDFVLNKLKECITNPSFTVNQKYIQQKTIKNTTNYLFLTNHKHCLPLEDAERRYWIIFSPITKKDIFDHFDQAYFKNLFEALKHKEALRTYFLNRKISEEFSSHHMAPNTYASQHLKEIVKSDTYGYEEAIETLADPTPLCNNKIIISREFFKVLAMKGVKLHNNQAKRTLMNTLGYTAYNKIIRYDKDNHLSSRVYVKNEFYHEMLTTVKVKKLLNEPVEQEPSIVEQDVPVEPKVANNK